MAALLLASRPAPSAAVPTFTEIPEFGAGATIPVAWGDADGDGDWDLAVGNVDGQNYLFVNDGSGSFAGQNAFGQKSTFALVWGDADNDGDRDMAVGNSGTGQFNANRLVTNGGDGTFSSAAQFGDRNTIALAWADYDLDGDLDLAVGNGLLGVPEQNYLYRNDGGGSFAEIATFGAGQTATLAWADFDADGDPDLAVGNGGFGTEEPNALWVNQGDGTFAGREEFGGGDTASLAWGDADGDGDPDLAVGNWNGGQNRLYENLGDGTFAGRDEFGARDPNTVAWADCDHDGDLDLAVGNGDFAAADSNYLYVNDGTGSFTEHAILGLGSTDALAWADADGDGDLDLAAGNEHHPTTNSLYRNDGPTAEWIELRLEGQFHARGAGWSNRDGIGAKVSVWAPGAIGDADSLLGFREVEAHGGFTAQGQIAPHFGVPGRTVVDVRIAWPGSDGSFLVQDLTGLATNAIHAIAESNGTTDAPDAPSAAGALGARRAVPNPTRGATRIVLAGTAAGSPGVESIDIVDVAGRVVRRVPAGLVGSGVAADWDGRDEDGRLVPAGVYFARPVGRNGERSVRIVAIR